MTPKRQRAASAIALLLVFSLSQVYVHANLAGKSSAVKSAAAAPAAPTGKLTTRGNNPILVNGIQTSAGTTILPGAQLQTPAGVGASVQIGKLGLLRMSPETSLTLHFNGSSVDVRLASGYATLTTGPGVKGSLTTPDGKTEYTDSKSKTVSTVAGGQSDDDDKKGGAVLGSGADEGEGVLGGISNDSARAFGLVVLGGAVGAAILIVATSRGGDPSQSRP